MNLEFELNKLEGQSENSGFFNMVAKSNEKIDDYFEIRNVESKIKSSSEEVYAGINMEALSTSYLDYYKVLKDLGKNKVLVDIGAGYCRGTLLANELNYKCISVELDRYRASIAKLKYPMDVHVTDLKSFNLSVGDAYFIYLPWSELSNQILEKVYKLNAERDFYIIESHGDFIDNIKLYKEFELVSDDLKVSSMRHDNKIYKFRFNPSDRFKKIKFTDYSKEDLIPLWFIKYRSHIKSLNIETTIPNGRAFKWKSSVRGSYCCHYNGKASLYLVDKSRYLQYHFDTIIDVEAANLD